VPDLLEELGRLTEGDEQADSAWDAKLNEINNRTAPETPDTQPAAEEAPAEADTAETEHAAAERPRDEHGRFTRVDTPSVDEHTREDEIAAEEEALQPQAASPEDELLERYLAKHNGDVAAALKAAANQESLLGRQGNELGELRARLDQLESRPQETPSQPQFTPLTESDVERLDSMVYEGRGQQALAEALQRDPSGQLGQRVFDAWSSVNPGQATAFMAEQIAESKVAALRAEIEPVRQANQQNEADASFVNVWNGLSGEVPDLEQLVPGMSQILESRPALAKTIVESDPETQKDLLRTVAESARSLQEPHVQEAIASYEAERAEASRTAKQTATVVAPKGAIGSPPGGAPSAEKTPAQAEADAIRARILDTPDTSISSGWSTE
jgi:hypothetical protein